MASLADRIGVDVLAIILDRYLDMKSRLRFERTSKKHQQLVIESFQRIKHLYVCDNDASKMELSEVEKLMYRCGPNVRRFEFDCQHLLDLDENDSKAASIMAREFPLLIELP